MVCLFPTALLALCKTLDEDDDSEYLPQLFLQNLYKYMHTLYEDNSEEIWEDDLQDTLLINKPKSQIMTAWFRNIFKILEFTHPDSIKDWFYFANNEDQIELVFNVLSLRDQINFIDDCSERLILELPFDGKYRKVNYSKLSPFLNAVNSSSTICVCSNNRSSLTSRDLAFAPYTFKVDKSYPGAEPEAEAEPEEYEDSDYEYEEYDDGFVDVEDDGFVDMDVDMVADMEDATIIDAEDGLQRTGIDQFIAELMVNEPEEDALIMEAVADSDSDYVNTTSEDEDDGSDSDSDSDSDWENTLD
jgi:hypothetical protein